MPLATNSAIAPPLRADGLKRRIVEFAHGASTEISTHDDDNLPVLAKELPAGTTVYIAHVPSATLDQVVRLAMKVQGAGFRASPHIVARRLEDPRALRAALRQLRSGGVEQVLLVAGDRADPVGSFASTLDVLATGYLDEEGFRRAGVCGHPEGNKAINAQSLWQALRQKQSYAERSQLQLHIVTQFSFDPEAICAWARTLAERGISLPVHVGIAGPTPLPKLIKFAMHCGVGASLRSVMKNMSGMSKMARLATSPDEMLVGLVQACSGNSSTRLVQPHFFSFGGTVATARWLRRVRDGRFELPPDGGKFLMNT